MPQCQIAQAQIIQHFDLFADGGFVFEKRDAFFDGHIQHVINRLAAQRDFERLGVKARAFARAAGHFDIRHEIKLRRDCAFALTLFAAPAFGVEAKPPGLVIAFNRKRRAREQVADVVVKADIRRGVRAAAAANRRLVNVDDFVNVFESDDGVVRAG